MLSLGIEPPTSKTNVLNLLTKVVRLKALNPPDRAILFGTANGVASAVLQNEWKEIQLWDKVVHAPTIISVSSFGAHVLSQVLGFAVPGT